jgi:hypothetical protein
MDATPATTEMQAEEIPVDQEPETGTEQEPAETFIREIPGAAGNGPARAYGYIALATAMGAQAELTAGGTRNTSRVPLQITVTADAETFAQVNDLYDEITPVAEATAAEMRAEARKEGSVTASYDVSLLTRGVLAGFPQGVASALVEPGTTKPAPLREATRARRADERAHRRAVVSGRQWAESNLNRSRARILQNAE